MKSALTIHSRTNQAMTLSRKGQAHGQAGVKNFGCGLPY